MRSRLQWAGHVERMADDRLPKRAAELREQGRRRRGRPRLRWEDCVKRDVRKAGEEEDWKKKTRDRVGWKILSDEAVKKLRAACNNLGHSYSTLPDPHSTWTEMALFGSVFTGGGSFLVDFFKNEILGFDENIPVVRYQVRTQSLRSSFVKSHKWLATNYNVLCCNYPRSVCVRTAPGNVNMVAYGTINTRLSPSRYSTQTVV